MKRIPITAVLLAFGVWAGAALAGDVVVKPELTLTLPDGWVEIPAPQIERLNAYLVQTMHKAAPSYAYGFQRKGADLGDPPYMLVKVNTAGRWRASSLREAMTADDMNKAMKERLGGNTPDFLKNTSIGAPAYDEKTHLVWINGGTDGQAEILGAMIPTQTGYVLVTGYSAAAAFPADALIFRQVILSATVPENIRYRETWIESLTRLLEQWGIK